MSPPSSTASYRISLTTVCCRPKRPATMASLSLRTLPIRTITLKRYYRLAKHSVTSATTRLLEGIAAGFIKQGFDTDTIILQGFQLAHHILVDVWHAGGLNLTGHVGVGGLGAAIAVDAE